ncbi:MAG TPA: hypothetical protein VHE53_01590 [Patescibacteria group bacterium]|nr:hypothetical protein [Patescibacteria group bacterium]
MGLLLYPIYIFIFWYQTVCIGVFRKTLEIFSYVATLLSVPLLLRTFFKPLKNEYRDGLVLFSVIMGIIIKTILLSISLSILLLLSLILISIDLVVILMPVIIIGTFTL